MHENYARNMLESEIYQESFIGVVVDEVHCVTKWGKSSNNKIVQLFVLFVCGIFVTLAILTLFRPIVGIFAGKIEKTTALFKNHLGT